MTTCNGFSESTAEQARRSARSCDRRERCWSVGERRMLRTGCNRGSTGGAFRGPFFVLRHDPPPEPPVVKGVTGQFLLRYSVGKGAAKG